MIKPEILGPLSGLHEVMADLLRGVPPEEANARCDPLASSSSPGRQASCPDRVKLT